jgi:hypothetical protein
MLKRRENQNLNLEYRSKIQSKIKNLKYLHGIPQAS